MLRRKGSVTEHLLRAVSWIARGRAEDGQTLPLMAMVLSLFAMFGVLAVDVASAYGHRTDAQAAVDFAALAGAQELPGSPALAVTRAREYLEANGWDPDDAETDVTFQVLAGNQIEVVADRAHDTFFASMFGISFDVGARAVAERTTNGSGDYSILVLNESDCEAFHVQGNADVEIDLGGIMVNSSCPTNATSVGGNGDVITEVFDRYFEGGVEVTGNADVQPMPSPVGMRVPDPLAGVAPPDLAALGISPDSGGTPGSPQPRVVQGNGDYTLRPGVYYGGLELRGNTGVTLLPGIYAMAGGGLRVNGNTDVFGDGVMLYNTMWNGSCGEIRLNGNAPLDLSGYEGAPYDGITFWQDESCTHTMMHRGNSDALGGVVYLPSARYDLSGNGDLGPLQVIADTVYVHGNGDISMEYEQYVEIAGAEVLRLVE